MEFKIGDRVIVTEQKTVSNYENTLNCVGTIDYINPKNYAYGLILDNKNNPNSNKGRFYFSSDEIRRIPTFTEIKEAKMNCIILTNTQKEANLLDGILDNSLGNERPCELWAYYEVQTVYYIRNGKISSYGNSKDIGNGSWLVLNFKDVYISEFGDAIAMGTRTKIKNDTERNEDECIMSNKNNNEIIVMFTDGEREELKKINNNGHSHTITKKIQTVNTIVTTMFGTESTTCDKEHFDEYTGVLVAAAKTTAQKSEEAWLIYLTAIDMWGSDMCISILKSLANRATGGHFERTFKEWKKKQLHNERVKDIATRTCAVCKRVFNTAEEAREHEKWHNECKIKRQERKEAKRRIAKAESEGRITEYITEIINERNKINEKVNNET